MLHTLYVVPEEAKMATKSEITVAKTSEAK